MSSPLSVENGSSARNSPKKDEMDSGTLIDVTVRGALSMMLSNIPVAVPTASQLQPSQPDYVEVGSVQIVGDVWPQNFDVGYQPDGARITFDSKTLNNHDSVEKNWQDTLNDLATEATQFPSAVVGFAVAIPTTCLAPRAQTNTIIGTSAWLGSRKLVNKPDHRAKTMSLVS
ncbi:hypothetical protein [Mycobacterium uberis]|uniref:hypothetical protein n=1 Tax=Mycobacterium uberis TaxID=2162698 RepID=UPI001A9CF986|nr:hypothetical protein [Mycobacterium uberis]